MLRRATALLIAGFLVVLTGTAASAQDYPPDTAAPPTDDCPSIGISASGPMVANATVDITLTCATIEAGRSYSGSLQPSSVALPPTAAQAAGSVTFRDIVLPADWETDAMHSATLVDVATGQVLGTTTFYVDGSGNITAPPAASAASAPSAAGALPSTGSDAGGIVKVGALLVAAGAFGVLAARRRRVAVPATVTA